MRVRGAIHLHSTFSSDGTLTVAELAALYRRNNYQFIGVTEHAEDLNEESMNVFRVQCKERSSDEFIVIPGVEYDCGEFHILSIGSLVAVHRDVLAAIETIHRGGGLAVLPHPKRFGWMCPEELLRAVDAIEIWNVNYDGKFLPPAKALNGFVAMRQVNPRLLAVAGHDLHQHQSFYNVALEMDLPFLSTDEIMEGLRRGCYEIRSRYFRSGPALELSPVRAMCLRVLSEQLRYLRFARSFALGWLP